LVIPQYIVSVFLDETDPGFHEILVMTTPLFTIVAVFQLFDGLQAITSRALRAMKDTIVPLWYAGFGYWVLGVGGGYLLAFPYGYAATGLWWGMALGLVVTASLLTWRFFKITARSSA